jgi:hypothetical protein
MKQKGKARADRVLTEERVPYLTDRERKSLARFLALKDKRESSDYDPRFVADPSTALPSTMLGTGRAGPDEARNLLADAERFVARVEAFLREQGALTEHLL